MSGRSPPLYCTLILITMHSHQSYPNITTVVHGYEYSPTIDNIPSRHTGIGAWVNSKMYNNSILLYNIINFHARVLNKHTEYTGSLGYNSVCLGMVEARSVNVKKTTSSKG